MLYYRVGKNGTETNFLQWFKSWKGHKSTVFDAEYRDALREFKRKECNIEDELKVLMLLQESIWRSPCLLSGKEAVHSQC